MENTSRFAFIEEIAGKMNLAGVELEIHFNIRNDGRRGNEVIHFLFKDTPYKSAIQFGAEYFFDHYYSHGNYIDVSITLIRTREMLNDTNSSVMAYVTIISLSNFFNFKIVGLDLNKETGLLTLPIPKK